MISKALRGRDLPGLLRYLFGPGRAEEHTNQRVVACSDPTWAGAGDLDPAGLAQLIAEMDDPKVRHGDHLSAGYVFHVPISLPAADGKLSDGQWQQVAATFAGRLGLDGRVRWVAVGHGANINGNDHLHLVVNLIRDDGTTVGLSWERLRRREACRAAEDRFGLTGTAPAGRGEGALSRREVEAVRSGRVGDVHDLTRHRVATVVRAVAAGARSEPEFVERLRGEGLIVRPRAAKDGPGRVVGYSVAARGGDVDGKLVWYGGGTLSKELRLPALRARWGQTDGQRGAAAGAWTSAARRTPKAEAVNLAGAADALRAAADVLERVPVGDRAGWQRAAGDSAGVLAAAAAAVPDDRLRRELIGAWTAVRRATPPSLSAPVAESAGAPSPVAGDVRSGPAGVAAAAGRDPSDEPAVAVAWTAPELGVPSAPSAELSGWLAGSRVLMASRLADAPAHTQVRALVVQAAALAAQISRTIAAGRDATSAQHRAAAATARAAELAAARARPAGWQFTKSGEEVLTAARATRATVEAAGTDTAVSRVSERDRGPEQGR